MSSLDFDWIVIGSGFGGSVAAMRLSEKGYRVAVVEQGRRFEDQDFASSAWQARRLLWAPRLGLHGIMQVKTFKHVTVLAGVGVGGGSLVYGNTLYVPHSDAFYAHRSGRRSQIGARSWPLITPRPNGCSAPSPMKVTA